MNKNIIFLSFLLLLAIVDLKGNDRWVEFRYIGCQNISPGEIENIVSSSKMLSPKDLNDKRFFWANKIFADVYYIEKNAEKLDQVALMASIDRLSVNLKKMKQDPDSDILFRSCYVYVLECISRLIQSSNHILLDDNVLEKVLVRDLLTSEELKYLRTYASMLIIAKKIIEYRLKTGNLPKTLGTVNAYNHCVRDAWGNMIQYKVEGSKYWLWSLGGRKDTKFDAQRYIPSFNKNKILVFSEDFSELRRKLYHNGKLQMSPLFYITLDKKHGTISATDVNL